jgi:hypothetical protein
LGGTLPGYEFEKQRLNELNRRLFFMPREWSDKQRAEQAERCRQNQPWRYSTGPRTKQGKTKSSMNAKKPASVSMLFAASDYGDYRLARCIRRRLFRPSRKRAQL